MPEITKPTLPLPSNFQRPHLFGMTLVVKQDVPPNPPHVDLLRAVRVALVSRTWSSSYLGGGVDGFMSKSALIKRSLKLQGTQDIGRLC
jgi:hypothetical protein